MPSDPTVLWLPLPPSTNKLWRTYKGRIIKSAEYRKWLIEAAKIVLMQRPKAVQGKYQMTLTVERKDRRRTDLSNRLKALEDALVTAGVVEDDSLAERIVLEWSNDPPTKDAQVIVTIEGACK